MSVERIAPLGQTTIEPPTTRPAAPPPFDPGRGGRASPPPSAPVEGPSHLYDSLALPLLDMTQAAAGSSDRVSALYREEATSGAMIALVDGRLPVAALRQTVEALLADLAAIREISPGELIAEAEKTDIERLPSRNSERAHFTFKARLAAFDSGKLLLLDLYLTRIGGRQWEAAAYERTPARAAGVFPRPSPLVDLHRLVIDADTGQVRACIPWGAPNAVAMNPSPSAGGRYGSLWIALVSAAALLALFLQGPSWAATALLILTLVVGIAAR